jgi:hypothetical protein
MELQSVNKRGSIMDLFFIMCLIFVTAIVIVLSMYTFGVFKTAVQEDRGINDMYQNFSSPTHQNIFAKSLVAMKTFDTIFMFVIIGLFIGLIVSSFMIQSHPIFFIVNVIVLAIVLLIAAQLSNVFDAVVLNTTQFNATAQAYYPKIIYAMANFPYILLLGGALALIALFAKGRQDVY